MLEYANDYWSEFFREDLNMYYVTLQVPNMNSFSKDQALVYIRMHIKTGLNSFIFKAHPQHHFWYGNENIHGVSGQRLLLSEVNPGDDMSVAYSYQLTRNIQMEEQSGCRRTDDKRFVECLRSEIESTLQCSLPWLGESLLIDEHPNICSEEEQINVTSVISKMKAPEVTKQYVPGTECAMNCDLYIPSLTKDVQVINRGTFPQGVDVKTARLSLTVFMNQLMVPVEETVLMYDSLDAMADVGGYLGLLLGASCWSMARSVLERACLWHKKMLKTCTVASEP